MLTPCLVLVRVVLSTYLSLLNCLLLPRIPSLLAGINLLGVEGLGVKHVCYRTTCMISDICGNAVEDHIYIIAPGVC